MCASSTEGCPFANTGTFASLGIEVPKLIHDVPPDDRQKVMTFEKMTMLRTENWFWVRVFETAYSGAVRAAADAEPGREDCVNG